MQKDQNKDSREIKNNEYLVFKSKIKNYTKKIIDEKKLHVLDEPNKLKDRIGFPYRLDRYKDEKSIMILGVNPSGKQKDPKDYLCYIPGFEKKSEYVYNKYYKPNYNLVREIEGIKMYWSSYEPKVIKKEKIPDFEKYYHDEKNKKGPYLVFANSVYFHETTFDKFHKVLKKDIDLNKVLKSILECQLNYYNPKLVIVTNAWVSDKIHEIYGMKDVKTKAEIENICFVFSGFISSGRLDKYNTIRLKEDINEILMKEGMNCE